MRISEFGGELAVIDLIAARYGVRDTDGLPVGIGDDAALITISKRLQLIVTTDLLVEGTHFRRDIIDAYSLGWKSVAANISDIAAMAGRPTYTFPSIAFDDVDVEFLQGFCEGMSHCARAYGSVIAGGDTNISKDCWAVNVTQLGEVETGRATLRSGARAGDVVMITGTLGDSRAGLELLLKVGLEKARSAHPQTVEAHLRPRPRVSEAAAAAGTGLVHAMMDVSDGLAADLPKLCSASRVGALVHANAAPVSEALRAAGEELHMDAEWLAMQGGEDYELLFTVSEGDVGSVSRAVIDQTATPVAAIGVITSNTDVLVQRPDGMRVPLRGGWEHFI